MQTVDNLVIVAHPDDEILGFGGAGAKRVTEGESVQAVILSGHVDARAQRPSDVELLDDVRNANRILGFMEPVLGNFPNIRMNTVAHLDMVQFIEKSIEKFSPRRIFTHHPNDLNNDHVQVSKACLAAARLFQRRTDLRPLEGLYYMEILSSTDWAFPAPNVFQPDVFEEIHSFVGSKIEALKCYRSVMREYPHPRSEEVLRSLATLRGAQSGLQYAEAFQLVFKRGL